MLKLFDNPAIQSLTELSSTWGAAHTKAPMVLEVTILGQGPVVEIDSDLLEPMGSKLSNQG
jgi:hypothetical protein